MSNQGITGFLVTAAAFWHVVGFAFGLVYIIFSFKGLIGITPYDRQWSRIVRTADLHLWLSGLTLMALGIFHKGYAPFFSNPKLLAKLTVVCCWFLSTQLMRCYAVPQLKEGNKRPMLHLSAVNISCWVYGAILGCAKPLSYGVVPYSVFLLGFFIIISLCYWAVFYYANTSRRNNT